MWIGVLGTPIVGTYEEGKGKGKVLDSNCILGELITVHFTEKLLFFLASSANNLPSPATATAIICMSNDPNKLFLNCRHSSFVYYEQCHT